MNKVLFIMILLILSIGAVSAAEYSVDNMTADTDVDLVLDDSPERVASTNVNVDNWNDLKQYCKNKGTNYVIILTGNQYNITERALIQNSVTIIGSSNSYITGNLNDFVFLSTNSRLNLNFINVEFKDINCNMLMKIQSNNCNFVNCTFNNITTGNGQTSVIYNQEGNMNFNGCNFINCITRYGVITNHNSNSNPGIAVNAVKLNVNNCNFVNNSASVEPGAINNCGLLNVTASNFINNQATWWAGAIHTHYNAKTRIVGSNFIGNYAGWNGGALYTYSTLEIYNSTFKWNNCSTNNGGGAIGAYDYGSSYNLTVENCIFEDNNNLCVPNGRGGAISVSNGGKLDVHGSTFINNNANIGQAICSSIIQDENATTETPDLQIYNNTFINHTGSSNTVEIQAGTYLFENNIFINSIQNIPQSMYIELENIEMPCVSLAKVSGPSKDEDTIIYLKNGTHSLEWGRPKDTNQIVIGENRDGVIINDLEINAGDGASNSKNANYTFINMTIYLDECWGGAIYIDGDVTFINCTFIESYLILNTNFAFSFNLGYPSFGNGVSDASPDDWRHSTYTFENCYFKNVSEWCDVYTYSGEEVYALIYSDCLSTLNIINCTFENITAADDIIHMDLVYRDGDERINIVNPTIINCDYEKFVNAEVQGLDTDDDPIVSIIYTPEMNVAINDGKIGETNHVVIALPADATGNVTVNINNKTYKANVVNGTATINADPLDYGNYAAIVNYDGDGKYSPNTKTINFAVNFNNYLTNETFFTYFNQNGTLKDEYGYDNLTFNGLFADLGINTIIINKPITIIGNQSILNNIGLNITSNNVVVKDFELNINNLENAIIVTGDNVTLTNNRVNYNATNGTAVAIKAVKVTNLTVSNNNIAANIPSRSWQTQNAALVIDGSDIVVNNNKIDVTAANQEGAYSSIYGVKISGDNSIIKDNAINVNGLNYTYGMTVDGEDVLVDGNNVTVICSGYYAGAISVNAPFKGNVTNNNIKVNSKDVAYGIFDWGNVNSTYANNVIEAESNSVYAIEACGNVQEVTNNTINAKGNYTLGIAGGSSGSLNIKDNKINIDGKGLGNATGGDAIKSINAGIYLTKYVGSSIIEGNEINANIATVSYGNNGAALITESANTKITNNKINATVSNSLSDYNSFYGVKTSGDNTTIDNNNITVKGEGYTYAVVVSGEDVAVNSNNIDVVNDKNYACGLNINAPFAGEVSDNNIVVKSKDSAYGIYTSQWGGSTIEGNYTNNNIDVISKTAYAMELMGEKETVDNNTITVNGEYTMGIATSTNDITISNNTIVSNGTGEGSTFTYDMFGATNEGILIYDNKTNAKIIRNDIKSTGDFAVNVLKSKNNQTTVTDNVLITTMNKGNNAINNVNGVIANNTPVPEFILISDDIVMYFKNGTRWYATLTDGNATIIKGANITFALNGEIYDRTTNANGTTSIALNLNPGTYTGVVSYKNGNDSVVKTVTVTILSTISSEDMELYFKNGSKFNANFTDGKGNKLEGTAKFNINGVIYDRKVTNGTTSGVSINLNPGVYTITAINELNGEMKSFNITILSTIIAENLTMYYMNGSTFNAVFLDGQGNPLNGSETKARFNINGVFYDRSVNENGTTSGLALKLNPGEYVITVIAPNGEMKAFTIIILPDIIAEDFTTPYKAGLKYRATALDGQGKPQAGVNLTFNINGIMYYRTTNESGVSGGITINLIPGEYIMTVMRNDTGAMVSKKVTITPAA